MMDVQKLKERIKYNCLENIPETDEALESDECAIPQPVPKSFDIWRMLLFLFRHGIYAYIFSKVFDM
jgi:hypothetical protein